MVGFQPRPSDYQADVLPPDHLLWSSAGVANYSYSTWEPVYTPKGTTMHTYVCTVGNVRSPIRILLVPECCLYCGRQLGYLSRPWVYYIIGFREQGRDLVFIMYAMSLGGSG